MFATPRRLVLTSGRCVPCPGHFVALFRGTGGDTRLERAGDESGRHTLTHTHRTHTQTDRHTQKEDQSKEREKKRRSRVLAGILGRHRR